MPSMLSKNCVFVGEVDCYCLVCCQQLPADHDVLGHIQESKHKRNLSLHAYCDKFKHDYIRKVSRVYFCELCNRTFATATKVGLHVTDDAHLERKRTRMLKRGGKFIVFHENILISENAWNGLVDDACVLCNAEFEDAGEHRTKQTHILNLISSKVTISANNDIYRQVDGVYQCLTCNKMVSGEELTEHLSSPQHKSLYKQCDRSRDDVSKCSDDMKHAEHDTTADTDIQSPNIDGKTLYTRPVPMKNKAKPRRANVPAEVQSLAEQHGLSVTKDDNKVYCGTCSSGVPATLHDVTAHVASAQHTHKLAQRAKGKTQSSTKLKKVPIKEFITLFGMYEDNTDTYMVINNLYFVKAGHFMCIINLNGEEFSLLYNKVLTNENIMEILQSQQKILFDDSYVITSLPNEFVRQLKTDLYNCVFCGHLEHDWDSMLKHLDTNEHKKCKEKNEILSCLYNKGLIKVSDTDDIYAKCISHFIHV